ncbi:dienelactone hydrolase family protein [Actinokineospora bangkokensis]|uniref:Dienelactone hydrolase n=1 Tax=Actinokineospora bangkokensis TaxID=1193682 RepID=A0A1Q9LJN6_9PSEU|nr:dienelactone hydrolase family protein [Actinokineospora bangkokensis]OLR92213.1 dienelactone hydrolase [Actinokineospora bangkokensis]
MRRDVRIPTPDGTAAGTLHLPEGDGPWPGVVFFPDAGGPRDAMWDMADRLAGTGYAVLVPDVYYRAGDWAPFSMETAFSDPDERARLGGLMSGLTNDRIEADAAAYTDFLLAQDEVRGDGVGTTGYCMGGRMSLIAATALGTKVAAAASFHGGNLAVEDDPNSPHLAADRISATVYVAGATDDRSFTEDQAKLLDTTLTTAGVPHTVEFYPAAHGFAVPDNPTHDSQAEERHWTALATLYRDKL